MWTLLALALVLRLAVAWWNYGFLALDDYTDIIVSAVPSQQVDAHTVIETSGIRSPIPRLAMLGLVRVGLTLGIDDSLNQVRWMYAWLGLFSMLAVAGGWWLFTTWAVRTGDCTPSCGVACISWRYTSPPVR